MSREREIRIAYEGLSGKISLYKADYVKDDVFYLLSIIDEQRQEIEQLSERAKSYERLWVAEVYGEDSRQYRSLEEAEG